MLKILSSIIIFAYSYSKTINTIIGMDTVSTSDTVLNIDLRLMTIFALENNNL